MVFLFYALSISYLLPGTRTCGGLVTFFVRAHDVVAGFHDGSQHGHGEPDEMQHRTETTAAESRSATTAARYLLSADVGGARYEIIIIMIMRKGKKKKLPLAVARGGESRRRLRHTAEPKRKRHPDRFGRRLRRYVRGPRCVRVYTSLSSRRRRRQCAVAVFAGARARRRASTTCGNRAANDQRTPNCTVRRRALVTRTGRTG